MADPRESGLEVPPSRRSRVLYAIVAPLVVALIAFWFVLRTAHGEGPSVGGRGMVLTLILLPAGVVATVVLNCWILFVPVPTRLQAFLLGSVVPAVGVALAYAYLWRVGPFGY